MHDRDTASAPKSRIDIEITLPPLPTTLAEMMKMRGDENPDVDRLIEIVRKDPALIVNILRRINSAYFGLSRKVSEVDKAITLLGYREVFGIAFTAAVKQALTFRGTAEAKRIYRHVMRTSVATAVLAKAVAGSVAKLNSETAFTAGLLHQIGRLVILYSAPRPYVELWSRIVPPDDPDALVSPTTEMERFVFGTTYVEIGSRLAHEWDLPPETRAVIDHHLHPEDVHHAYRRMLTYACAAARETALDLFEPEDHQDAVERLVRGMMPMHSAHTEPALEALAESRDAARRYAEEMTQD